MVTNLVIIAALSALCLAVVFADILVHTLHRLRKRPYDERCPVCSARRR